jgi:hypothetical protein
MPKERIERHFPRLVDEEWRITSESDPGYNCIAFAAFDTHQFWDPGMVGLPGYYWPPQAPREHSLKAWVKAFETHDFQISESGDLEPETEKIAIYVDQNGNPTHVARQLPDGKWTSKLGKAEDIEHNSAQGLDSDLYGKAAVFMMRRTTLAG